MIPFMNMAQPFILEAAGIEESSSNRLKIASRIGHYSAVFWNLIRTERLRPPTNPDKSVTFSSDLYKRLYNTTRVPGVDKDEIHGYFKTAKEGQCPTVSLVIARGRVFCYDSMIDGVLLSPQEHLHMFRLVDSILENEPCEPGPPILTADFRNNWAKNRKHLIELSPENAESMKIIEKSAMTCCFSDSEPRDYCELAQEVLSGDYNAKWNDKGSGMVVFKNGKVGFFGEHSAYDGTISIAFSTFILLSLIEEPEPNWEEPPKLKIIPKELTFQIDDYLRSEIDRMQEHANSLKYSVIAQFQQFKGYGKSFMKTQKIHPDSFVQMALQLAYFKLHGKLAPTYETATMRIYYHGRTETVRSCSIEVKEWIDKMKCEKSSNQEKAKYFKIAAQAQNRLMNEARKGKGIDRHLFGLWCVAQENGIEIPAFYDDPLYKASGGGGNFVLSTSTLGYTINVGFVAPMVTDGYGTFYSMLDDEVVIIITSYRDSTSTSSKKFYESFEKSLLEIKEILEDSKESKL